jgi:shikimate kinase
MDLNAAHGDHGRAADRSLARSHIVLLGLTGAGTSSAGMLVAERIGRPFIDSDLIVEHREGAPPATLFVERGAEVTTDAELSALRSVVGGSDPVVYAAASNVVEHLGPGDLERAWTVWLEGSPDVLAERIGAAPRRPMLGDDPAVALAEEAESRRARARALADAVVEVDDRPASEVADAITDAWRAARQDSPDEPSPPVPRADGPSGNRSSAHRGGTR